MKNGNGNVRFLLLCLCFLAIPPGACAQTVDLASSATPVATALTEEWTVVDGVAYRTLRLGSEGADVLTCKLRMQELGFFATSAIPTDSFNVTMEERVKQYQTALGQRATGILTPELQALLQAANGGLPTPTLTPQPTPTATPSPSPTPAFDWVTLEGKAYRTLQLDMEGEDVLDLKQRMQALGFFAADAELTDRYNVTMAYKVKQMQQALGQTVTGIATPELQAAIVKNNAGLPTVTPVAAVTLATEAAASPAPAPVASPLPQPGSTADGQTAPAATATGATEATGYRILQRNSSGEDVRLLKKRLQELGYFPQNAEITGEFNTTMTYKVKQYQDDLGIKATGIATPELQVTAFSDYGGLPTPVPPTLPDLPELTTDGFLPSGEAEYVYEDTEEGLWIYLSDSLHVEITRYSRTGKNPLVWFETSIRFTDEEAFSRFNALQKYKNRFNTERPNTIASRNNLVLAFSDDFFGFRKNQKYKQGIIIENGEILADEAYESIVTYLPPLDIMAFYADGSARTFYGNEYSAQELLDMGVQDTLCFGPVLLKDGQLGQQVADGKYASKEPRCALGTIGPRHYVLLTVEGRVDDSEGADLNWVALRMKTLGVKDAINLDGGNTTALVFRGQLLNKCGTFSGETIVIKGVRSVSSILGIGKLQTPLPSEEP